MNANPPNILNEIVRTQKRGEAQGIYAVCSAHPQVIDASFAHSLSCDAPLLIESTSNQVNQFGGYTGMLPQDFAASLWRTADQHNFPRERLILGGDHLGPNPWQHEPAASAMDKACVLVRECVLAGYTKIHLDASMKCADDAPDVPLAKAISAQRAAQLAQAAEIAFAQMPAGSTAPCYIIGTEVPVPGGASAGEAELEITDVDDVQETIDMTRAAFVALGLDAAWERVIGVVVQPGVEFGDAFLHEYDRPRAEPLARFIERSDQLIYEAHSTDYQTPHTLRALVEDHFAILKVGPALTFAFREAIFALAAVEEELLSRKRPARLSRLREVLNSVMIANTDYWDKYYSGNEADRLLARQYSFSDRARYYWPMPEVQRALRRLTTNLSCTPIPLTLLSQYMPVQYEHIRSGILANTPDAIIADRVAAVLADYAYACGYSSERQPH